MTESNWTAWRTWFLTLLRVAVGWHFLYEGVSKITAESWSAGGYLQNATGILSEFYHWLASSETMIRVVDGLNMSGLVAIGLALFLGILIRPAAICGAVLLALYYFAYPPFGASLALQNEPGLFVVNALFIEATVLIVFVFLRDQGYGIGVLLERFLVHEHQQGDEQAEPSEGGRRQILQNLATLPLLGLAGWGARENNKKFRTDAVTGATIKVGALDLGALKGALPKGKIGGHEISRLVMGGNLIGGWAHSRDLLYVASLFKAYNTEQKVFETLMLAEQAGINTINIGFSSNRLLQKYKRLTGSKLKVITQVACPDVGNGDYLSGIDEAVDFGVDIIQVQGNQSDWLVRDGKTEVIGNMLDHIRSQGIPAGLGAHSVETLIACEKAGIIPDYYMKTMHHDRYWSAHPRENREPFEVDGRRHLDHDRFHDNLFCLDPEKSVEFVRRAKVPVMGFKVLAAGAIKPQDGFRWAFKHGADFICVGMFDFQIVKDVNITIETLAGLKGRDREWFG